MNRFLHSCRFYRKNIWRIYLLGAQCPANTNLNLIRSTYSKSLLVIKPLAFFFCLIYDDVTVYWNAEIMKANQSSIWDE